MTRLKLPPVLKVSDWANKYRYLSAESSAESGRFDSSKAAYQNEVMDSVLNQTQASVVFMASSQVGKSEIMNNIIGYFIAHDPSPILVVQPTVEDAESYSKDRIFPMIRDTPVLKKLFDMRSKGGDNTIRHKRFAGGNLNLVGANSPSGLASKPKRVLVGDEIDRWPFSAGDEGNPWKIAEKRTITFHNRVRYACSTPTIKGRSRIEEMYLMTDQRKYFVPCPHCKEFHILEFSNLKWHDNNYLTTEYVCPNCSAVIEEKEKDQMIQVGEWRATATSTGNIGYHINAMYSPWQTWKDIVRDFLESKNNPNALRVWKNTTLGETFEDKGEEMEWKQIYSRREHYAAQVPQEVLFLTMGVDLQKDRIEAQVVGWTKDKSRYVIDYRVIRGNIESNDPFKELEKMIYEKFAHESGAEMPIEVTAIDTGAFTQRAYDFCKKFSPKKVLAIKGVDKGLTIIAPAKSTEYKKDGKSVKRGLRLWLVATDIIKTEFYGFLKIENPTDEELKSTGGKYPQYYVHFPKDETGKYFNADEQFFKQITSEVLMSRTIRGVQKWAWVNNGERNEALDTHIYARAAANFYGLDRFKDHNWAELEAIYGRKEYKTAVNQPQSDQKQENSNTKKRLETRKRSNNISRYGR